MFLEFFKIFQFDLIKNLFLVLIPEINEEEEKGGRTCSFNSKIFVKVQFKSLCKSGIIYLCLYAFLCVCIIV